MKLHIRNVAKVKDANLELDGITIIVGDNNTGKTTVGRTLFSLFNSLVDIKKNMMSLRERECISVSRSLLSSLSDYDAHSRIGFLIESFLAHPEDNGEDIRMALHKADVEKTHAAEIDDVLKEMRKIRAIPSESVRDRVVYNYFRLAFNGYYMPVPPVEGDSCVNAKIGGGEVAITLTSSAAHCEKDIGIMHHAYFIDSPDLLSCVGGPFMRMTSYAGCGLGYTLVQAINEKLRGFESPENAAIGDLLSEQRINDFCNRVETLIKGRVVYTREEGLRFLDTSSKNGGRFDLRNVSQGQKALSLILLALSSGVLKPKDVLILDEPEIHLHPEWEMFYAEMITLLQQQFELTILLTTHSPTFMRAVQLYALEHGLRKGTVKVYQTGLDENGHSIIRPKTDSEWDSAYLSFLNASYKLQDIAEKHAGELYD